MTNIDDMSIKEIRELCGDLGYTAQQFGEIRATLIINCQKEHAIGEFGITYDENRSVLNNMVYILEQLCNKINDKKQ